MEMERVQKVEISDNVVNNPIGENCHQHVTIMNSIDYSDFFHNYMVKNIPCVIKNVSLEWNCSENWVIDDKINTHYLTEKYGDLTAPVANCNEIEFNAHKKIEMELSDYVNYLRNQDNKEKTKLLYLKDWHLRKLRPDDQFYQVPIFFSSDWLNEFALDRQEDDFMFVYIGPKESWTPIHVDVYHSFSWSVNIVGRKKWILFPPGEETKLQDSLGNMPLQFDSSKEIPINYIEVIQEKGDAIFVPSGWYHQVLNMVDTISINHNWVNACNIDKVWDALQNNLLAVQNEIRELKNSKDYELQCQLILKSVFGMDFIGFVDFVCHICKKRILEFNGQSQIYFNMYSFGDNHIEFDLQSLKRIVNLVTSHPQFEKEYMPIQLKNDIYNLKQLLS